METYLFAHSTENTTGDSAETIEDLEQRDNWKNRCNEGDNA